MFAVGKNHYGQLGLGDDSGNPNSFCNVMIPNNKVVTMLSCGASHSIALCNDGSLIGCGHNSRGQLGLGDTISHSTFETLPPPDDGKVIKQISCGGYHTMVVCEDGSVLGSGHNEYGQLGLGTFVNQSSLQQLPPLPQGKVVKTISCGERFTMIVTTDGDIFGVGRNYFGQLGIDNGGVDQSLLTMATLPRNKIATQVACGSYHTFVLCDDGALLSCGYNALGQLGFGDIELRSSFEILPHFASGKRAQHISTGASFTIVLCDDGTLFGCGDNEDGQLNLGHNITPQTSFQECLPLPGRRVPKKVLCGDLHVTVMSSDGAVFSCGRNEEGQLGLGHNESKTSFSPNSFFATHPAFSHIVTGPVAAHTFALREFVEPPTAARGNDHHLEDFASSISLPLMFTNTELIGSDGVSMQVHSAMLRIRCPHLLERRVTVHDHAPKRARKALADQGSSSSDEKDHLVTSTVDVQEATGKVLRQIMYFMYTDSLPCSSDTVESIVEALDLMVSARSLLPRWETTATSNSLPSSSSLHSLHGAAVPSSSSMYRLEALCESHISLHVGVSNVVEVLHRATETRSTHLQQVCFRCLAEVNPVKEVSFSRRLIESLSNFPDALAQAFAAASSGHFNPACPTPPLSVPDSAFPLDLEKLWLCTQSENETSPWGLEAHSECTPDCVLVVGATCVRAHRFILAARSDYFKAALRTKNGESFLEGATSRINLKFPEPAPSLASFLALLRFIYSGALAPELDARGALDVLRVCGLSDGDQGGYFGLRDNLRLRSQALDLFVSGLDASNALPLLRRATFLGQDEARECLIRFLSGSRDAAAAGPDTFDHELFKDTLREELEDCDWWRKEDEIVLKSELLSRCW